MTEAYDVPRGDGRDVREEAVALAAAGRDRSEGGLVDTSRRRAFVDPVTGRSLNSSEYDGLLRR